MKMMLRHCSAMQQKHLLVSEFFQRLEELLREYPCDVDCLINDIVSLVRASKSSRFDLVAAIFNNNNNQPLSAADIATAAGMKHTAVRDVIYKTNPQQFRRHSHPTNGRKKLFNLAGITATPPSERTCDVDND